AVRPFTHVTIPNAIPHVKGPADDRASGRPLDHMEVDIRPGWYVWPVPHPIVGGCSRIAR
ncbi:MAG: hypothetical protein LC790_07835, partial [Actinobacteria bacterium]|nr:hypothetical protein [Actinomycetota bacterium]